MFTASVFFIPFVMCGNNKQNPHNKHALSDTILYAGTCRSLAIPFGVDTTFLDTIKCAKVGNDSILFLINDLFYRFTDSTKHFYVHDCKFAVNDSGIYKLDFSKKNDIGIYRFHILKNDSAFFYREQAFSGMDFISGAAGKKIPFVKQ